MGPGYFIIAILGCADGSANCAPVATPPARYESIEACSAATSAALVNNSDLDFPTLVAECRPASATSASASQESPITSNRLRG